MRPVRSALPSIRCPSIVFARHGDVPCPFDEVAWLAEHIGGARFVPLDGADHPFWAGDTSVLLDELESFVASLGP
jgi:pimeloyl-ACP methyl ester carboxylesterase